MEEGLVKSEQLALAGSFWGVPRVPRESVGIDSRLLASDD